MGGSTWSASYNYLKDGNLDDQTVNGQNSERNYTGDLLASSTGNENYSLAWDENGNLTTGVSADLEWTWELQLRQGRIDANNKIVCKYSPDGVMTEKISTLAGQSSGKKYITADFNGLPMPLLEIDTGTGQVTRTNIFDTTGQILLQHDGDYNDDRYFYLNDRLGSVRLVIDDQGYIQEQLTYSPFGEPLVEDQAANAPANGFRFANYRWDAIVSQYYCNARWFDPALYRFTGRDPVYGDFNEPLTLHAYLYCLNNPINRIDPSGELSYGGVLTVIGIGASIYGAAELGWDIGAVITGRMELRDLGMQLMIDAAITATGTGIFKLGGKLIKMAGASKIISKSPRLLKCGEKIKHHIFNKFRGKSPKSQKYRDFFKKHNIDVDDFQVELPESVHKDVHKAGQNWTTEWKKWIDANPNATTKEVYQRAGEMMDEFGISNYDFVD